MKPYIHATIIFAGFVMIVGTASIVTAEYKVVTKGAALWSMLDEAGSAAPLNHNQIRADRVVALRDSNPMSEDVAGRLHIELAPRVAAAPLVEIQATSARHATRVNHSRYPSSMKKVIARAPKAPQVDTSATASIRLASLPREPDSKNLLPAHFRVFYVDGKPMSIKVPAFNFKCTKDGFQFKVDEKAFTGEQKEWQTQLKTLPKNITTLVELKRGDDAAREKELGSDFQLQEVQSEAFQIADSARESAMRAADAERSADDSQVKVNDSDFGN